jgi:hypothetical protein
MLNFGLSIFEARTCSRRRTFFEHAWASWFHRCVRVNTIGNLKVASCQFPLRVQAPTCTLYDHVGTFFSAEGHSRPPCDG